MYCKSEPGDVVAFDMRCWHASWGGSDDRRMCTLVYYNNPKTPEEDAATRNRARSNAKSPEHFNRPGTALYDPHWVENPMRSEKRQLGLIGCASWGSWIRFKLNFLRSDFLNSKDIRGKLKN